MAAAAATTTTTTYVYVRDTELAWIPGILQEENRSDGTALVTVPDATSSDPDSAAVVVAAAKRFRDCVDLCTIPSDLPTNVRTVSLKDYDTTTSGSSSSSSTTTAGVLPLQNVDSTTGSLLPFPDMVHLPYLHEAAILYNLKQRHLAGQPYTRTGGNIVLAVNPYQWFHERLYSHQKRLEYSQTLVWKDDDENNNYNNNPLPTETDGEYKHDDEEAKDEEAPSLSLLDPHVYEVSAMSYNGLLLSNHNQSILVSGESGAGKTETVKLCMDHLASIPTSANSAAIAITTTNTSTSPAVVLDPVVQRVVESNPLLEAFGNAKTRRNDNSSRFGKYLQLQFLVQPPAEQPQSTSATNSTPKIIPQLVGSHCSVYLLEKNRVVTHDAARGEQTFHIFYQLLSAPNPVKTNVWEGLDQTTVESFKYVGSTTTTGTTTTTTQEHAKYFARTIQTLQSAIGLSDTTLQTFLRAICAVLAVGNLTFAIHHNGNADESELSGGDAARSILTGLAELLEIKTTTNDDNDENANGDNNNNNSNNNNLSPVDLLSKALTERTMTARSEDYKVPLNPEAAKEAADALAKEMYHRIFLWLVQEINRATSMTTNSSNNNKKKNDDDLKFLRTIGLLDIFGFESFAVNGFEQLCINYANEKLQQKFTEDIFRSVQAEYRQEGIPLAEIWYDDNTDVLDLIEGRTGLLALLNEECVRPKGNDEEFVQKALQINQKSPCLIADKHDRVSFGIHHYAGIVMYDSTNFVIRNQDTLPSDLYHLLSKQSNNFILAHDPHEDEAASLTMTLLATEAKYGGASRSSARSGHADNGPRAALPKRSRSNIAAPTVWAKYKTQLANLMQHLRQTQSRYIRCIKPNSIKAPRLMEHNLTVDQLQCAGVVAAITLSRSAFPNRLPNGVVRNRYVSLWNQTLYPSEAAKDESMTQDEVVRADCTAILTRALKCKETHKRGGGGAAAATFKAFVVGRTKTFFRAGALEYLESLLRQMSLLDRPATIIEKIVRGYLVRKKWDEAMRRHIMTQANDRGAKERRAAEERKKKQEKQRFLQMQSERERETRLAQDEKDRARRQLQEKRQLAESHKIERHAKDKVEKLKGKLLQVRNELDETKSKNKEKLQKAQKDLAALKEERDSLSGQYEEVLKEIGHVDKKDIETNKTKIEQAKKLIDYLKKDTLKQRDKAEQLKFELKEKKTENNNLVTGAVCAEEALGSIEKQKKSIAEYKNKLDDNLKRYQKSNVQLKYDLQNRMSHHKAEKKIRAMYLKAMQEIVELVKKRSDNKDVIDSVLKVAQETEDRLENS